MDQIAEASVQTTPQPVRKGVGGRWLGAALLLVVAGVAAVAFRLLGWMPGEPPAVSLQIQDPAALAESLPPADTVADAAANLAATLRIPPEAILVQLQEGCACSVQEGGEGPTLETLSVAEATERLGSRGKFWLRVQNLSCFYMSTGEQYRAYVCQLVPE
ncbi:hypothetical protein FKZ61_017235 [Litorilinea aerophila]|uniref:Uncharacterized protein n=1 Tax=Litorilinea aerophila TaxID=1204385 RepID=A0A540VBY3_9CHLR|nr:hypothetical protein [Litorilinea aerophila]MCC9077844.1 hypothetical protein [Litorilinea aerophila]